MPNTIESQNTNETNNKGNRLSHTDTETDNSHDKPENLCAFVDPEEQHEMMDDKV